MQITRSTVIFLLRYPDTARRSSLRRRTHQREANPRKTTPNPNPYCSDDVEPTTNMIRVPTWAPVLGRALATARWVEGNQILIPTSKW